ncbi:MAG TPA: peptidoglycan DD-metalloendopeptidase family protein [Solimonas sp.]|nr:peptidoglycan DD-metalloendopeptidase family protein [Solimonas sp.]
MSQSLRPLLLLAVLALTGCAGLGSWEQGRREVYNAPPEGPAPKPERNVGADDHLVKRGDTVYSIAFRNNLDFREVAKWNGVGSDYLIRPGQVLRLKPPPAPPPARYTEGDVETQAAPEVDVPIKAEPVTAATPPPPLEAPGAVVVDAEGFQWVWPTNGVVGRGYEPSQGSKGLDFTGKLGQPVFAAASGRVVYSGNALKGYGELIIIKHDEVHLSAYGYNRQRHVKEGDVVTTGQPIGEMGLGPENKPLLHFEIRERGKPVNPVGYLPAKGKLAAKAG